MRRVVSLFLPTWPTDRLRRNGNGGMPPVDRPLVTVTRDGQRRVIAAADAAARAAGLHPGMPLAQAQTLVRDVTAVEAAPDEDRVALHKLACWAALRYSPLVATDDPDGLWIDATGCTHLHADERAMLTDMVTRVRRIGIGAFAARAETPGAAHAFARYGEGAVQVVAPGDSGRAAAALPVAGLRLPAETVGALRRLGIARIGDLRAMPRAPLARRFGVMLLRRLDQLTGDVSEPIDPIELPEVVHTKRKFLEPIATPEQLTEVIRRLAVDLCEALAARHLGLRQADLLFRRVDGTFAGARVGTASRSHDAKHLARLLLMRLDTIDPGFGIEEAMLAAPLAEPLHPKQLASNLSGDAETDIAALIDNLVNRIGPSHLYRLAPVESDLPERSLRSVPALACAQSVSWPCELPRPVRMFTPPEPVDALALLPDRKRAV